MRTDYQPEIFNNMLESIDLENHLTATYYIRHNRPGETFHDYMAFIQSLALESSTGTWEKIKDDTLEVRDSLSCKLIGYWEIPTKNPEDAEAVIQFAFRNTPHRSDHSAIRP
jgi:ribulose 1,5-bisphosphate carboxylase large subunit-like protein